MTGLYRAVGVPAARSSINNFLGRKADSDMWEDIIREVDSEQCREEDQDTNHFMQAMVSAGLLKQWLDPTVSIETVVQNLYSVPLWGYLQLMEWQVRRIIQTEQ